MITTDHTAPSIIAHSRAVFLLLVVLLAFVAGCADDPECLFAPLPDCFSDGGGDSTEEQTRDTVNEQADAIDASVVAIRNAIVGIADAIQTAVNDHLDSINTSTTSIRNEVDNRNDGFYGRVDTHTDDINARTSDIRTAVQTIDAATRDTVTDELNNIDASTVRIDERLQEDCQDTLDNDTCDAIGT